MRKLINIQSFDTLNDSFVYDVQPDFYGRYMATAASDCSIHIYNLKNSERNLPEHVLMSHNGPVYKLSWAHPSFGMYLASASHDRTAIVWKYNSNNKKWEPIYTLREHESPVTCCAWSNYEFGLTLATGSMRGSLIVISLKDNQWKTIKLSNAHRLGIMSLSWGPHIRLTNNDFSLCMQLVTGGMDTFVKIWEIIDDKIVKTGNLSGNKDVVRSVAWAPDIGDSVQRIASAGNKGELILWQRSSIKEWEPKLLHQYDETVWSVSWSLNGLTLAASIGKTKITLWRQTSRHKWVCFSSSDNPNASK